MDPGGEEERLVLKSRTRKISRPRIPVRSQDGSRRRPATGDPVNLAALEKIPSPGVVCAGVCVRPSFWWGPKAISTAAGIPGRRAVGRALCQPSPLTNINIYLCALRGGSREEETGTKYASIRRMASLSTPRLDHILSLRLSLALTSCFFLTPFCSFPRRDGKLNYFQISPSPVKRK